MKNKIIKEKNMLILILKSNLDCILYRTLSQLVKSNFIKILKIITYNLHRILNIILKIILNNKTMKNND